MGRLLPVANLRPDEITALTLRYVDDREVLDCDIHDLTILLSLL